MSISAFIWITQAGRSSDNRTFEEIINIIKFNRKSTSWQGRTIFGTSLTLQRAIIVNLVRRGLHLVSSPVRSSPTTKPGPLLLVAQRQTIIIGHCGGGGGVQQHRAMITFANTLIIVVKTVRESNPEDSGSDQEGTTTSNGNAILLLCFMQILAHGSQILIWYLNED